MTLTNDHQLLLGMQPEVFYESAGILKDSSLLVNWTNWADKFVTYFQLAVDPATLLSGIHAFRVL